MSNQDKVEYLLKKLELERSEHIRLIHETKKNAMEMYEIGSKNSLHYYDMYKKLLDSYHNLELVNNARKEENDRIRREYGLKHSFQFPKVKARGDKHVSFKDTPAPDYNTEFNLL